MIDTDVRRTMIDINLLARLAAALDDGDTSQVYEPDPPPEYVVVRGDRSGVFAGVLAAQDGQTVDLTEARHIWYWSGAANTADMALRGVSKPNDCKFVAPVARLRVLDAIEIIPCTVEAEASLRAVPAWTT